MKNRKLLLVISLVLAFTVSIGSTLAFLTDTDEAVNVMTLGNVQIEQLENDKEENGFRQGQPLYPAHYAADTYDQVKQEAAVQDKALAELVAGVVEKRINVKNTGSSEAYIRTLFAVKSGTLSDAEFEANIHLNWNPAVAADVEYVKTIVLKGANYRVYSYTYPTAVAAGATAGETLQSIVMDKLATNEIVAKLGKTFEVLVLSQAIQTENMPTDAAMTLAAGEGAAAFHAAKFALDTGFGTVADNAQKWFEEVYPEGGIPTYAYNESSLTDVLKDGGNIHLGGDVELKNEDGNTITKNTVINLAGNTVSTTRPAVGEYTINDISNFVIQDGANVVFEGGGTVINEGPDAGYAIAIYDGSVVTIKDGYYESYHDAIYVREGTLIIEGGMFRARGDTTPGPEFKHPSYPEYLCHEAEVINCYKPAYDDKTAVVIIKGGTFVNEDPSNLAEGSQILVSHVAEGYKVVSEVKSESEIWYTVVPE